MSRKYDCVVLTYNVPHRKTYDTLCLLKATGYSAVLVWAVPMHYKKKFRPLFEHRPEITVMISPDVLCENLGYEYVISESGYDNLEVSGDTPILVCGAGFIPESFIRTHTVINAHPGFIPLARGLDAFKWEIVEDLPIGVTTHLIGDEVDAGQVIERREIPVYVNDTFHALAQRVYENEIEMLVDALCHLDDEMQLLPAGSNELHKRMPADIEKNLMARFGEYVKKHAVSREASDCHSDTQGSFFVHETSVIDVDVTIGEGTKIWHFSHVQKGARIGRHCSLGQNVNISNHVRIGDGCKLQNNVSLYEGVELEDYVFCGPSCVFTNDLTPRAKYPKGSAGYKKTLVREGASIGANATIICGHTIGRWALIGAGAVVASNVPNHALMLGVPAKRAGWVCECGAILRNGLECEKCGRKYEVKEDGLSEVK